MAIENVFTELSKHMLKGLMFHEELANYFAFLGLEGYSCCHEYHYEEESCSYRKLNKYYITHYNRLIQKQSELDAPSLIPLNWYAYERKNVDVNIRRNAVKDAFQAWIDWESNTKKFYEEKYEELCVLKDVAAALYVVKLIKDVDEELKGAESTMLKLQSVSFDMTYIIEQQDSLKEKYMKKTRVN